MQKKLRQSPQRRGSATFSHHTEAMMSRVITFDKGSKRRIKRIRWRIQEVVSVVLLSFVITLLGALLAVWEVDHYREETGNPHIKAHR